MRFSVKQGLSPISLFLVCCVYGPAIFAEGKMQEIPYVEDGDAYRRARCKLDVHIPDATTGFPTVVWFHGGGLTEGEKHFLPFTGLSAIDGRSKIAQIAVNYRLMSETNGVRGVDCIRDAAAAVAWSLGHVAEYGGDPKRVYVAGMSAGAYLAMMIGMDAQYLGKHGFRPADLAGIISVSGQATKHFAVRKFEGDGDSQFLPKLDELAPMSHVSADLPMIVSICGQPPYELKGRAEENRLLIASCVALGHKRAYHLELPLCNHGRAYHAAVPYIEMIVTGQLQL